eukprot:4340491-Amphidinium_carterae.1
MMEELTSQMALLGQQTQNFAFCLGKVGGISSNVREMQRDTIRMANVENLPFEEVETSSCAQRSRL